MVIRVSLLSRDPGQGSSGELLPNAVFNMEISDRTETSTGVWADNGQFVDISVPALCPCVQGHLLQTGSYGKMCKKTDCTGPTAQRVPGHKAARGPMRVRISVRRPNGSLLGNLVQRRLAGNEPNGSFLVGRVFRADPHTTSKLKITLTPGKGTNTVLPSLCHTFWVSLLYMVINGYTCVTTVSKSFSRRFAIHTLCFCLGSPSIVQCRLLMRSLRLSVHLRSLPRWPRNLVTIAKDIYQFSGVMRSGAGSVGHLSRP